MLEEILDYLNKSTRDITIIKQCEEYAIIEEERVGKKYKIAKQYMETYDITKDNPNMKIFFNRGFKFGEYIEILISYLDVLDHYPDDFEMGEFQIGDKLVKIDRPSLLFDLSMAGFGHDKYYSNGDYWTISIKGITTDNYEEYISKALFLFGYYNQSTISDAYPECYEFLGEEYFGYAIDEDILKTRREDCEEYEDKNFKDLKYYEAISFYNEGMILHGHEISFQYFYKVLEHFFLICRQDEFKAYINDYNTCGNITDFIDRVTNVYKQNEEIQLKILLKSIQTEINSLINSAYTQEIISSNDISIFSDGLYKYRNTIVHGKRDERFNVKVPSYIGDSKEEFWNIAVNQIAEILIKKYCF